MNRKFTALLSIGIIAGFAACGNGESDTPAQKEANKRNDLEAVEKNLASMKALDAADSSVRSVPVTSIDDALQMFRCVIAESCSYNKEAKALSMTFDGSRLETLESGNIEYKMSDQSGKALGTATFVPQGTPEKGIIAYIEISAGAGATVKRLDFMNKAAWPENGLYRCSDYMANFLCDFINSLQ